MTLLDTGAAPLGRFSLDALCDDLRLPLRLGLAAGAALGLMVVLKIVLLEQAWGARTAEVAALFAAAGAVAGFTVGVGLDLAAEGWSDWARCLASLVLLLLLIPFVGAALFALLHLAQFHGTHEPLWTADGRHQTLWTLLGAVYLYLVAAPVYLLPGLPVASLAGAAAARAR